MQVDGISPKMLRFWAHEFGRVQTERHLRELLEVEPTEWLYLTERATYRTFQVPKPKGGLRLVEDPEPALKEVLRRLNQYLQAVYFGIRSEAAFGFLVCPDHDLDPRNVLTNARRHCGRAFLLNADFLDFFHAVSQSKVADLFGQEPFGFSEQLSAVLARLCCYKGRLPMGSPTSPVLSNFATRRLDNTLLALARQVDWCYTRFADDLSFSAQTVITRSQLAEVRQLCWLEGFRFNEQKVILYGPEDQKFVTGLLVTDTVDLPADAVEKLRTEIARLQTILQVQARTRLGESAWVERFKQQLEGHLRFTRFVLGDADPDYQLLRQQYNEAQKQPEPHGAVSWLDFDNYI